MDIFSSALSGLGVNIEFDQSNIFSCALTKENEEQGLFLSAYRDLDNMSLHLSVMTRHEVNDMLDSHFWTEFATQAMGPFRNDMGIGILEGTRKITVYQSFQLSGKPQNYAMQIIEQLTEAAEYWDEKLHSPL
ncbi:hypothetical protein [uncultured Shewanella sp.]|uniref:hypothetical protein n=1 Tax=uncultured Shewanella sp. TaxID=173975 RepID=UPI0026279A8F|nr:hypothetical protein [uncultured Shewanella sp.]